MRKKIVIIFLIAFNKCYSQKSEKLESLGNVVNILISIDNEIELLKTGGKKEGVKVKFSERISKIPLDFPIEKLDNLGTFLKEKEKEYYKNGTYKSTSLLDLANTFLDPLHIKINNAIRLIDNLIFEEKNKILDKKLNRIDSIRNALLKHDSLLRKDSIEIVNLKKDNQCLDDSIKAINIRLGTTKKYYDSLLNAANKKIESLEEKLNCKIDSLNFKQNLINKENKRSVVYLDNNLSALNQYLLSSDCKIDSLSFQISLQEEKIKELENKQPVPSVTDTTNLSKRIDILENQLITLNLDNISIKLRLHQLKMREIEIGRIKEKLLSLNSIISYHHTEIARINTNTRALDKTITSMNKKIITIEPVPNPKNYKQNKATFNQ